MPAGKRRFCPRARDSIQGFKNAGGKGDVALVANRRQAERDSGLCRDLLDYCHGDALAIVSMVENLEGMAQVVP